MSFDQHQYNNDYTRAHYDKVSVLFPKGKAAEIKQAARDKGLSISQFIVEAVETQYGLDLRK